uniref:type IV secretion system protein n=1 Tax=Treponema sp. TaxID=166 RepID=UPI00388DDD64
FSSKKDRKAAQKLVEDYKDKAKYTVMFGAQTLSVLERVLVEKEMDGTEGDNLTNTYVDLDMYLRDAEGNQTYFISPSALLKVSLLSCQIMFEKENTVFNKVSDEISNDEDLGMFDKLTAQIAHQLSRVPQMIMVFFCCIVLILSTIFAEIQYVMTILEYTIICGIGAIFIPLMLFDGTKDIPKKLIPVFISFLVKIMVITICLMFVYYLMIENCINTIADDGGMNWTAVGEIAFEAILCYILTQNAPKIAQTILTGQPQLSMGEFVAGAGTAMATAGGMKAVASGAARTAYNKGSDAVGGAKKMHAAASAASGSLGGSATHGQKFKAAMAGAGAVASAELKEKMRAKAEKFSKGHSSIPIVGAALQKAGFTDGGSSGGGAGGSVGGASAHGMSGQGRDGKALSTTSNPNFATATKYDEKTQSQRNMTHKEFNTEKMRQGVEIGSQVGEKMKAKIDAQNAKKAEQGGALPENLSGNERANKE